MPLAGLLALASLAGALVWASSAGAVVLSGVPCKGNASISGSVLVSAPVLGEVCTTAEPRFHHGQAPNSRDLDFGNFIKCESRIR